MKELMNLPMSNVLPWKKVVTTKTPPLSVKYNYKVKYTWHNNKVKSLDQL